MVTSDATTEDVDALIAQMQAAVSAPEPGTFKPGQVVSRGAEIAAPIPMTVLSVTSAGYVRIYDTRTGEESLTNRNMLPSQLKKRRADGSQVFTTVSPKITPFRGKLVCPLHPSRPERAYYDTLGLPHCPKSNMPNEMQVMLHMQHRHRTEWATIDEERKRKEREEEREFQRAIISGRVVAQEAGAIEKRFSGYKSCQACGQYRKIAPRATLCKACKNKAKVGAAE